MRFASVASCRPSPLHTSHQLPPKMASVTRIAPGQKMPSKMFKLAGGGEACIAAVKPGHIAKLVVIYRGQFCPFCKGTLANLQAKLPALEAAKFELMVLSADSVDVTAKYLAEEQGGKLTYPVACGLDEDFMRTLGIYISNPKNYQPQTHSFAEPAYFVLDEQSVIKYRCESSHPMGGRPDVDAILAGYNWSQQNAVEHPEYKGHVWGNK